MTQTTGTILIANTQRVLAKRLIDHSNSCDRQREREPFTAQEFADVAQRLHHHLGAIRALEQVWADLYGYVPSLSEAYEKAGA